MALIPKSLPSHGNLIFKVTTAPTTEPITAAEVRAYAKIDTDAEETLIESFIVAVRQAAEAWLGRSLLEQTITAYLDWWPDEVVKLPRPPLISVTSIATLDEDDSATTYSSDNYFVRTDIDPGEVVVKSGSSPPINTDRYHGGYRIVYTAGYGDETTDVPTGIKIGLMEWVLYVIENRIVGREPPEDAMPLLGTFRIKKI